MTNIDEIQQDRGKPRLIGSNSHIGRGAGEGISKEPLLTVDRMRSVSDHGDKRRSQSLDASLINANSGGSSSRLRIEVENESINNEDNSRVLSKLNNEYMEPNFGGNGGGIVEQRNLKSCLNTLTFFMVFVSNLIINIDHGVMPAGSVIIRMDLH